MFDLLKYGSIPSGEITSQDREKLRSEEIKPTSPPTGEGLKSKMEVISPSPKIIEAVPMKSSDAREEFTKMGVVIKKKDEKKDLYGE